jgi:hypothetical protein
LSVLAIGVEVTMILTLVEISYGTLHEAARSARGVGAERKAGSAPDEAAPYHIRYWHRHVRRDFGQRKKSKPCSCKSCPGLPMRDAFRECASARTPGGRGADSQTGCKLHRDWSPGSPPLAPFLG